MIFGGALQQALRGCDDKLYDLIDPRPTASRRPTAPGGRAAEGGSAVPAIPSAALDPGSADVWVKRLDR